MSAPATLLDVSGVEKRYPAPAGGEGTAVLRGVSFQLARGASLAVVGPSGSGKSTLLHLIGALDRPSAGRIAIDGVDLATLGERELARLRNEKIGFVFQSHHLLPQCTALENALLPSLVAAPERRAAAPQRARALLERVGLGARLDHRPGELSGGERQRVAVVRALVNRPALLLADEPTGSLDARAADALGVLLRELQGAEEVALVVVTHSSALAARMERALELSEGVLAPATP